MNAMNPAPASFSTVKAGTDWTSVFIVGSGLAYRIESVVMVNTDEAAQTINLGRRRRGDTEVSEVSPVNMNLGIGSMTVFDNVLTFEAGDELLAKASFADVVKVTPNGMKYAV